MMMLFEIDLCVVIVASSRFTNYLFDGKLIQLSDLPNVSY